MIEIVHCEGNGNTCNCIEQPEQVVGSMVVNNHVTAYLLPVHAIIYDFDDAYHFVTYDMKDENGQGMVANID